MMSFTYFNPVEVVFDIEYQKALLDIAKMPYKNILLLTSKGWSKRGVATEIQKILHRVYIIDDIQSNPQLNDLQHLKDSFNDKFDAIIAFGGGSVIDSAKFLSLKADIVADNGSLKIQNLKDSKDIFAFPTTAGTSSELTQWATIWDKDKNIKYSLFSPQIYPKKAFYDCSLMMSLPKDLTIYTALDALSHALESIWNKNANIFTINNAKNAIEILIENLPLLINELDSLPLRKKIALGSIYAGLAFSNTQTALAHAISYPITMRFNTPHGLACSFCLPLLLDCVQEEQIKHILSPYTPRIKALFEILKISTNPRDYGLDSAFIEEIFSSLNQRARNGIFDINKVKEKFLSFI